ncbi:pilus assembly protein TadG-related protein [Oceanicola sp. 22II-s10i]|uniref:pilus assembly protein TadG-related protein n=1 Tax=Oceanicola sp. 22II-s10i TaxID=1317116 RepID=UPI000B524BB7|nr:pilus assembly protein TadG-related protein [Oceanicola sp. 22II-s10i]
MSVSDLLRRYGVEQRGSVSILSVFTVFSFFVIGGLAVDVGNAYRNRSLLSAVADAASTAAALDLPDTHVARKTALEYIKKNFPDTKHSQIKAMTDIRFGVWDGEKRVFTESNETPTAVRVTLSRQAGGAGKVEPVVLQIIGFTGWDIGEPSTAVKVVSKPKSPIGELSKYLLFYSQGISTPTGRRPTRDLWAMSRSTVSRRPNGRPVASTTSAPSIQTTRVSLDGRTSSKTTPPAPAS